MFILMNITANLNHPNQGEIFVISHQTDETNEHLDKHRYEENYLKWQKSPL